jgi:ubiquinone/menaquinone biosynthesis C-methylase UbiE
MVDWRTYNEVAETYERVHGSRFADVARDLVAQAEIGAGHRVLDVGTGTGVAGQVAIDAGAHAAGIDESIGMLRVARRDRTRLPVAVAEAIDLPFRDGSFDAVLGCFVLAHFTKYQTALYDIRRVMRPDAVLAVSSWADRADTYQQTWRELVEQVVPREMLDPAYAEAAPWHDKFRSREAVEETLMDAGFRHVRTEPAQYRWTYSIDDYLDGVEVFATGRFVREMLGETGWASFRARARETFADRFPDPLHDTRDVILATARKP